MDCSIRAHASNYLNRSPKLSTKLLDAWKDDWLTLKAKLLVTDDFCDFVNPKWINHTYIGVTMNSFCICFSLRNANIAYSTLK